jgi:DNA-binding CsgD family transcriptional regulator
MKTFPIKRYALFIVPVFTAVAGMFIALALTGIIDTESKTINEKIQDELAHTEKNVSRQLGDTAVQAVLLSKVLAQDIENKVKNKNITLAELSQKPVFLKELLGDELNLLILALERTNCTGVYVILDATVNPAAPNAAASRAGLYIQNTEPVIPAMNNRKLLLRGFADLALENALGLQAQWDLEFDITVHDYYLKLYDTHSAHSELSLSKLYYWHFENSLNFVGEKSLLCSIPIIDSNDVFLGVCGFEISGINFTLYNTPNQKAYPHLAALIGLGNDDISLDEALFAGSAMAPQERVAISGGRDSLSIYKGTAASFTGRHTLLPLYRNDSPYSEHYVLALAMPLQDYNRYIWESNLQLAAILSVFLVLGVILSVLVIRRYLRLTAGISAKKPPSLENLGLSPREKEICGYLLKGLSIKQIGYELHISFDTVNSHYRSLYRKLGISSKAELFIRFGT